MKAIIGLLTLLLLPVYGWAYNAPTLPTEFDPGSTPTASVFKSACATVNINGATNASPTVISTAATHYWVTGQTVVLASIGGNTGANGSRVVTRIDSTHFSVPVDTSAGSAYTIGGTAACDYSSLQTAVNAAVNGWEIQLNQGETYIAPLSGWATLPSNGFILPSKSGTTYVVIRTYPNANLPADGARIHQTHRQYMAKIQHGTTNQASMTTSITCDKNTSYWWLKAIDFVMPAGQMSVGQTGGAYVYCSIQNSSAAFGIGQPPKKTITNVTFVGSTVTITLDIPTHGDMRLNDDEVIKVTCPSCGVTGIDGNEYTIQRVPTAVCTGAVDCTITFTQSGVGGVFTSGAGQYVELARSQYPHHMVYDQLYMDGESNFQDANAAAPHYVNKGIEVFSSYTAIINSQIHVMAGPGCETGLPITGTTGAQVLMIRNNSLSGSDMLWFFGGDDPNVTGFSPSDIVIRQNEMFKRPVLLQSWADPSSAHYWTDWDGASSARTRVPNYTGTNKVCVKNAFEMKNAVRMLIEGNTVDHAGWQSSQSTAIHFTTRQGDADSPVDCGGSPPGTAGSAGCAPGTETSDITYRNNIFRYGAICMDLHGQAGQTGIYATVKGSRFLFQNNLFIGCPGFSGFGGASFVIGSGPNDPTFIHNSFVRPVDKTNKAFFGVDCYQLDGGSCVGDANDIRRGAITRLVFQDNLIQSHEQYGVVYNQTTNSCTLAGTLTAYAPSMVWDHNIAIGSLPVGCEAPNSGTLATGTLFVATEADMNFRDYAAHDYCLTASSPGYHAASDGTNVGVDMQALYTAIGLGYGPGACP